MRLGELFNWWRHPPSAPDVGQAWEAAHGAEHRLEQYQRSDVPAARYQIDRFSRALRRALRGA